ncbi:hypothetical protein F53441_8221 [Fusarium austroafricanum]|uniref:Helicase n=1 Tax=Fusarium austroafricanum TaxID=2364996 RepID=A0A8H4NWT5_9HYPO|nr:hypothetical protein F53441_8221 [Fusarium austroafricanum]
MDLSHDDAAPAQKKIRLHSPEPDYREDIENQTSHELESTAKLSRDNISWPEIFVDWNDEENLDNQTEFTAVETCVDICLGVITFNATSSYFKDKTDSASAVTLHSWGSFLKLYTLDAGVYAGIAREPILSELLTRDSVKLNALLVAPTSLRIIVLSTMGEAVEVGNLLSKGDVFLQHPSPRDIEHFDLEMEYFNPHYLVIPGSSMPQLEDLAIDYTDSSSNVSSVLDERKKGQLRSIFDTAADLHIQPTTEPSQRLQTRLKEYSSYQLKALTVMSEKECFNVENPQCPSLWVAHNTSHGGNSGFRHRITGQRIDRPPFRAGGILADEMGLGKTLCMLSLIGWSLDSLSCAETQMHNPISSATLIVVPKSMIPGWENEIKRHIIPGQTHVALYHGTCRQRLAANLRDYDIVLTTYQSLRSEWINKGPLFKEQWFRVVLDEAPAHRIGNRSTQVFQAACELQSARRWCLTGTPIVNSLDNYGALLSFIKMEPFIEKSKFDYWVSKPVQTKVSDGLRKLQILVAATCLRRTKTSIAQGLPRPTIKIEKIDMFPHDRALYDIFETEAAMNAAGLSDSQSHMPSKVREDRRNILTVIDKLRRICNHGEGLLSPSDIEAGTLKKSSQLRWQTMPTAWETWAHGPSAIGPVKMTHGNKSSCNLSACTATKTQQLDTPTHASTSQVQPSAKVQKLIHNILAEQAANKTGSTVPPVKSVVFSFWTKMLDLVHDALQQAGFSCARIDGQHSIPRRQRSLSQFANDPCCTIMLATIGSSGEGPASSIDLTSANNVHLMEPHWNPMAEEQAIARVHRIGQLRHVTAIKYITPRSIEEYVQSIQHEKTQLIHNAWGFDSDFGHGIDEKDIQESNTYEEQV